MNDWLVMLAESRNAGVDTRSVHYLPREECERIAKMAPGLGCAVVEGPREMTEAERGTAQEREAKRLRRMAE